MNIYVFFKRSHDCIPAFKLLVVCFFFFPLRNFHHISASWMSRFRKVSFCLLLFGFAVLVTHFPSGNVLFWQREWRSVCLLPSGSGEVSSRYNRFGDVW